MADMTTVLVTRLLARCTLGEPLFVEHQHTRPVPPVGRVGGIDHSDENTFSNKVFAGPAVGAAAFTAGRTVGQWLGCQAASLWPAADGRTRPRRQEG